MILVTGGAGFIGRRVCAVFSGHGQDVIAVDRQFASPVPYQSAIGDLTDRGFLAALFEEHSFDAVVHLASLLNTASGQQPQAAMRVNIGVSMDLLQLAVESGVRQFVYGSSISAYGPKPLPDYAAVSETAPAAPNSVYGISKRYVEVVGETYRQQAGLRFVALRIASVVGTGAKSAASMWRSELFEKLTAKTPTTIHIPYRPSEIVPLVHVEDVAGVIGRLVEADKVDHSIYNTPSESWRIGELAEYVGRLNEHIRFTFGESLVHDIPQVIDDRRFTGEFGYKAVPIKQRLSDFIYRNTVKVTTDGLSC
jgi:nucleoside-diphosphate-sugar epimerase